MDDSIQMIYRIKMKLCRSKNKTENIIINLISHTYEDKKKFTKRVDRNINIFQIIVYVYKIVKKFN